MRIGHYAPDIWAPGGVSSYIRRLGRAQAARGDSVFYLTRIPPDGMVPVDLMPEYVADEPGLFRWAQQNDLDVLHLHKPVATRPPDSLPVLRTLHDHTANCPSGTRHLARSQRPCNRTSTLAACTWGYLVDGCGSLRPSVIQRNVHRLRQERRSLKHIPMHAISHHVKERMVADGYPADAIHVLHSPIPNVVPPYHPPPRSGVPRFLFLGRIVPEKGLAPLLRAVAGVSVPIHLDIAGKGYQQPAMEVLSRRLGLDDRVTFHGWVDPERVRSMTAQARAVVFPSIWNEPAGLISLEAAASGRTVIASRTGGIPEYATDDYAVLVPPGSASALADALTHMAMNYDRAAERGERGRRVVVDRFSMDTFLTGLDTIYESVQATSASLATA